MSNRVDEQNAMIERGRDNYRRAIEAESRLDSALPFVRYIAKRYEEGWDEPITERFFKEASELLLSCGGVVERQEIKS